ncbi:MAG: hypothetical protein NTX04_03020 [Verrucomicrobia bacterium]|nr:hypothetical protein [Verrucomicrobiota bacterium]
MPFIPKYRSHSFLRLAVPSKHRKEFHAKNSIQTQSGQRSTQIQSLGILSISLGAAALVRMDDDPP